MGRPIADGCVLRPTDTLLDVHGPSATLSEFGLDQDQYIRMELMFPALVDMMPLPDDAFPDVRDVLARCIAFHFYKFRPSDPVRRIINFTIRKLRLPDERFQPRPTNLLHHLQGLSLRDLVRIGW